MMKRCCVVLLGLAFFTGFCNVNVGICFWGGFFSPVMLLSIGIFPIFVRMLKSRKPFTPTNQRTARKYNVGNKIKYPCTNRVYALCLTPKIKCSNSAKAMQKELKRIHNGKNKHCSRHLSLSLSFCSHPHVWMEVFLVFLIRPTFTKPTVSKPMFIAHSWIAIYSIWKT